MSNNTLRIDLSIGKWRYRLDVPLKPSPRNDKANNLAITDAFEKAEWAALVNAPFLITTVTAPRCTDSPSLAPDPTHTA